MAAKAAGSRASPHKTWWGPRSHKSPTLLSGGPAETSGTSSAGSSPPSSGSSREAIRRSISPISKPVTSRVKSRPCSERSLSCSANRRSSQVEISVSRLSAILKARTCSGVRRSRHSVGTSVMPSKRHARNLPFPVTILSPPSVRIGTLKSNASMLSAICWICLLVWRRGLAGSGFSVSIRRYTIFKFALSFKLCSGGLNPCCRSTSLFVKVLLLYTLKPHRLAGVGGAPNRNKIQLG